MQNYFDNEATSSTLHATMKPARGGKSLVTLSTYEDRKEALLNTTILDDAGTCRSKSVKMNTPQQTRQQNDTVDSKETKQESYSSNIPKPPPLQMTNKGNNLQSHQSIAAHRFSNGYQNVSTNETYSEANKTQTKDSSTMNGNNLKQQTNRQTLRLGTVTIGEYRQHSLRKEPEKFDFIANQKRNKDSGETTPTNEALHSELQNTLSRANLRKSNGNAYAEHQRNCPLHQQQQQHLQQQRRSIDYGNNGSNYTVEELSKKLQKSSMNNNNNSGELLTKSNNRTANNTTGSTVGVGILKNGNGNRNGTSNSKSTEKSIKFS